MTCGGRRDSTGCPSTSTVPPLGRYTRVMTLKRVVLPAPLGPMSATTCPASTLKETRSSATTPPKRTLRSRTSRSDTPPNTKLGRVSSPLVARLGQVRRAQVGRLVGRRKLRVAGVRRRAYAPSGFERPGVPLRRGWFRRLLRLRLCGGRQRVGGAGWHRLGPRRLLQRLGRGRRGRTQPLPVGPARIPPPPRRPR